jgi:hypothetical protein
VDGQKQAEKTRRRRSRSEVERLVSEYEISGQSRTAFCQQKGLSPSTLARYRRRQREGADQAGRGRRWLSVEVSKAARESGEKASGLVIVLAGERRIEVVRGFDSDTLQRVLAVMENGSACLV